MLTSCPQRCSGLLYKILESPKILPADQALHHSQFRDPALRGRLELWWTPEAPTRTETETAKRLKMTLPESQVLDELIQHICGALELDRPKDSKVVSLEESYM